MRLVFYSLLLGLSLSSLLLSGCKQIKQLSGLTDEEKICLKTVSGNADVFRASGSAKTLEKAKLNARQDLALQISSNVSSAIENKQTASNNHSSQQSSSWTKSETENIPLDQHRIDQTCKSGSTYYAAASLEKARLLKSVQQRMSHLSKTANNAINKLEHQNRYQQYLNARHMQKSLAQLRSLQKLLTIYNQSIATDTLATIDKLQDTVDRSATLVLGLQGKKSPALTMIEQALNRAELEYQQGIENVVAIISLKTHDNIQRAGNRFIFKLNASIDVMRADTRKLLKRHNLGKIVTTSTVSSELAIDNAYQKLADRVRQHLNVAPEKIRKILGLE